MTQHAHELFEDGDEIREAEFSVVPEPLEASRKGPSAPSPVAVLGHQLGLYTTCGTCDDTAEVPCSCLDLVWFDRELTCLTCVDSKRLRCPDCRPAVKRAVVRLPPLPF